jgi:hypothetical protein
MRKIVLSIAIIFSQLVGVNTSSATGCIALNTPTVADDGITVTVSSIQVVEKTGSNQLTINYFLQNATADKKIDEGAFKIFFANGESTPQYGFFGSLFPTDTKTRSYTWEYLKAQVPTVIGYNAGFFTAKPSAAKLNWTAPGGNCDLGAAPAQSSSPSTSSGSNPASNSAIVNQINSEREALRSEIALQIKQNPSLTKMLLPLNSQLNGAESPTDQDAKIKLRIVSTVRISLAATLKKFGSTSVTCAKGKLKKTVTGQNPKCPSGYKPVASK